ncbi:MAG: hypothetical protein LBC91_01935 [Candidatus Accumulibacter sp.]|nr:hypothetical protein [Accumulibacter sp.]
MQPIDMRRRIRELQSIPERDRTDAEWDELNELEIRTAPGNRDYDRAQDRQPDKRQSTTLIGQGRRLERNNKLQGNKNGNLLRQKPDSPLEGRLLKRQHRRPKRPLDGQVDMTGGSNAMPSPIIVEIPSSGDGSDE